MKWASSQRWEMSPKGDIHEHQIHTWAFSHFSLTHQRKGGGKGRASVCVCVWGKSPIVILDSSCSHLAQCCFQGGHIKWPAVIPVWTFGDLEISGDKIIYWVARKQNFNYHNGKTEGGIKIRGCCPSWGSCERKHRIQKEFVSVIAIRRHYWVQFSKKITSKRCSHNSHNLCMNGERGRVRFEAVLCSTCSLHVHTLIRKHTVD